MTIAAGSRLGPYEILSPLGAGGMGEVYKAKDTRLERTVAVKVLPQHLSASAEVRQRFEREAKTISQLSHPHICALYDVGREGETEYLVMELLEGETLSDRLAKGSLPLEQTLRYGVEIADALDKAHRQGIVHRDLKPGNVMLTKSGVKLLDFGLAKAMAPATPAGSLTALPTQQGLTQEGTILGTFQYMAPEQLEGKDADARTDIFAFGAVLYEMATGTKAFSGATQASLIASIMSSEPPSISSVRPTSAPALDRVVRKCLAKNPDDRWQSASDLGSQLKWIAEGSAADIAAPKVAGRRGRPWIPWALAAAALLVAGVAFLWRDRRSAGFEGSVRSTIVLTDKSALRGAILSPDGSRLVVVARDNSGHNLLWIRPLGSTAVQALAGTDNPSYPFWSPDGRSIGFFADGKLKRIEAGGGPPQTLADAPVPRGGTWNRDGVILFVPVPDGPIFRIASSGGTATPVTQLDPKRAETSHRWPMFLPDGRHYLYLIASFVSTAEQERMGIYAGELGSKAETFVLRANSNMAYVSPGFLLFYRGGNLLAHRFDWRTLKIEGDPIAVADQISFASQTFRAFFSASENGVFAHQARTAAVLAQLVWFDRSGTKVGTLGTPGDQANPRISPDGKRVALDITDPRTGNVDVWVYEASGGLPKRFTTDPAIDAGPVWSPDGSRIAFMSFGKGHPDLYQVNASDGGGEKPIVRSETAKYLADWSPDGRLVLFRSLKANSNLELWVAPSSGDGKANPFIKATFGLTNGQFSPDGRWVAYASNESGKWEIYVTPFPGPGGSWKVSSAGGAEPRWRRDGKELYYLAPDGTLMAVDVKAEAAFEAGAAKTLFRARLREQVYAADLFSYDVTADGQRFLVNTDVGELDSASIHLVVNWPAELRK